MELVERVLDRLNHASCPERGIEDILTEVKAFTGFEAVAIRLAEGDDFPYYVVSGFPSHFVEAERHLCACDCAGNVIRDAAGRPVLDCMCGNVLRGRFDATQPFFTSKGSFWSNSTTELLASTTEEQRQARTRNRCNSEGYESVALVPLRHDGEVIGLMQLNDRRKDRFSLPFIEFLEALGGCVGIALASRLAYLNLQQQAAELRAVYGEMESFSYSVSHDLRAPLRTICGFSQALAEDCDGVLPESGKRHLGKIQSGCREMDELIDGILKLSRLGRAELARQAVDVSAMARDVLAELSRAEPGRVIETVVEPGLDVEADPPLLRVALVNLLGNAWKFTRRTAAPRIEFGGERVAGERAFFVRDNGAGFDAAHADKLFQPFQRLHGANDFEGTGIGLALVRRVVQRHDGRVWAEAEPGVGAVFHFTIPERG